MDSELKPCPFCGGEAVLIAEPGDCPEEDGPIAYVYCDGCGCSTEREEYHVDAIAAWNTRADTCTADQLQAFGRMVLEKAVASIEKDAGLCDCFAREENECACGAWDGYKTITSQQATEIVRSIDIAGMAEEQM